MTIGFHHWDRKRFAVAEIHYEAGQLRDQHGQNVEPAALFAGLAAPPHRSEHLTIR